MNDVSDPIKAARLKAFAAYFGAPDSPFRVKARICWKSAVEMAGLIV
jgi:hypothetical protein